MTSRSCCWRSNGSCPPSNEFLWECLLNNAGQKLGLVISRFGLAYHFAPGQPPPVPNISARTSLMKAVGLVRRTERNPCFQGQGRTDHTHLLTLLLRWCFFPDLTKRAVSQLLRRPLLNPLNADVCVP